MPQTATSRHALPNLFVGQAQKEITHNEALARIDALLHPAIIDQRSAPPASLTDADDGSCWLIGTAPTGAWSGKSGQLARWSGGSWRYLVPVDGMSVWHSTDDVRLFYNNGSWIRTGAIVNPSAGAVVDAEARTAISAILTHLRATGEIDP